MCTPLPVALYNALVSYDLPVYTLADVSVDASTCLTDVCDVTVTSLEVVRGM